MRQTEEQPKNHHYVPRCYLQGFTGKSPKDPKKSVVWEGSLVSGRVTAIPVKKAARAMGYYEVDGTTEQEREVVESFYGRVETPAGPILRRLNQGDLILEGKDREDLMLFAATLAVRGPSSRATIDNMRQRGMGLLLDVMSEEQFYRRLHEAHPDLTFSAEESRALHDLAKDPSVYTRYLPRFGSIRPQLKTAVETIYPIFSDLNWTFVVGIESRPFICSDCPVVWFSPSQKRPGLDKSDIEVTIPLGRALALLGQRTNGPRTVMATPHQVDQINSRSIAWGQKEILAPSQASVIWGLAHHFTRRF